MSAESDVPVETESEDGGVLVKTESNEVDIDTGSDTTPTSHDSGASSTSSTNAWGEILTSPIDEFTEYGDYTTQHQQPSASSNDFHDSMTSPSDLPQATLSPTSTTVSEAAHNLQNNFAFADAGFSTVDQEQHLHSANEESFETWPDQFSGLAGNVLLFTGIQPSDSIPPHSWSAPSEMPHASTDHLPTAIEDVTPMEHSEPPAGTTDDETAQDASLDPSADHSVLVATDHIDGSDDDWLGLSEDPYTIFADIAVENGTLHTLSQASNMASYYDHDDSDEENDIFSVSFFLHHWKQMYMRKKLDYPSISQLALERAKVQRPDKITAEDGDPCDYQGIHWTRFQTTKQEAREVRRMTYRNLRNQGPREQDFGTKAFKAKFPGTIIPSSDCYFNFNEMDMNRRPAYAHFQLRHNLSATSKNAIFYTSRPPRQGISVWDAGRMPHKTIVCFNPETETELCALDVNKRYFKDVPRISRIHTLTAGNGVLVAGSFEGVYAMKSLSADYQSAPVISEIASGNDVSTNHIHTYPDRQSGQPRVVFDSNDRSVRILDCTTSHWVACHKYSYQVNCSVTSPDGRLRLLNGDDCEPIVANAETGETLAKLPGHQDFGFACDWAADGITMATGHQDGLVKVWDARKLNQSIRTIAMEQAGCRSLQFSPLGSGKRVLVLAEPADFVHIVDAQTFESKQTIDFFGEISGISMPPDGSKLYIANADSRYGGLLEFTRCQGSNRYNRQPLRIPDLEEEHEEMVDMILDGVQPVRVEPFMHRQGLPFTPSSMIDETIIDCRNLLFECLNKSGGQGWSNLARTMGIGPEKAESCVQELYEYWLDKIGSEWEQSSGREVGGNVASQMVAGKGMTIDRRRGLQFGEEGQCGRDYKDPRRQGFKIGRKSETLDWLSESEMEDDARVHVAKGQRGRQWGSRSAVEDDLMI